MTYEEAYIKIYEELIQWLIHFRKMKPDKAFSADRIFGMKNVTENILHIMEEKIPDVKVIREELETWENDLSKGGSHGQRNPKI